MGSELDAPLLGSSSLSITVPRILDRDGTFAQSRGRWSVSNTVSRSPAGSGGGGGGARQRRPVAATAPTPSAPAAGVPYGVESTPPRRITNPSPTLWDRLCCRTCCCKRDGHAGLTPRRCWDDWFRKILLYLLQYFWPICLTIIFFYYFVTKILFHTRPRAF